MKRFFYFFILAVGMSLILPACKAKSCDTSNNIDTETSSGKRKKNIGLFSKKEKRKKKW